MTYLEDNTRTGRVLLPDLVRALALLGIVVVNVAYFAYPGEITYHAGGLNSGLDIGAYSLVNSLFLFKSYTLFSFMFGVGLAYQTNSANRHGVSFASSYFRRMFGLVVLGVLHITLGFSGDILFIYGVFGVVFFLFRNRSQKALVRIGIALIVVQVIVGGLFTLSLYAAENWSPEVMVKISNDTEQSAKAAYEIFSAGSFSEVAVRRWHDWQGLVIYVLPLQGPGILAFFLLGLAAVRAGVLSEPGAPLWSRARRVYLPVGIVLSLVGAWLVVGGSGTVSSRGLFGLTVLVLAAPLSSLGYIGLIAKWSQGPVSAFKIFVARGGTASLSAYLLQSLILSLVFCGYGFGLYQKPGAFGCVAIAFCTGLFSIAFSSLWRTRFKRGPMEALLRGWTYLGQR